MSSSIWTQCAGTSRVAPLRLAPWRVVEAQHLISTRKLVDSAEEQALLEDLIEISKPAIEGSQGSRVPGAQGPGSRGAQRTTGHVLLTTPFRYPPLRHGSRFGGRYEPGLWYGSEDQRTLFAEAAYYRLVFLEGTRADLGTITTWHTAFTVQARTTRGIDLTARPFDRHRAAISARADYAASQALGQAMREAGVELFRYRSARDVEGGANVGIFTPAVFGAARPKDLETWHSSSTRDRVEFVRRDFRADRLHAFPRSQFLVGGLLPAPAV
ncbi:MAG: RES family NAD+ phosphorylase [Vicinamibacterales bacterium]